MVRAMKDSGIEWIGQIPEHWEVAKLSWSAKFINGFAFKGEELDIEKDIPVIRIGDIQQGSLDFENCLKYEEKEELKGYCIKEKDIVIAMSGATTGKTAYNTSNKHAYINQRVGIIRTDYKYFYYCLNTDSFFQYMNLLSAGSAQPNISMGNILGFKVPYISLSEQHAIADYLDEKCGQIDETIENQKKVVEKLKEYKQSLITETVCKGLNPTAPMKDSGIEWIGKIPSHWEVKCSIRICNVIRGNSTFTKDDLKPTGDFIGVQYGKTYKVDEINNTFDYYVDKSFFKEKQIVKNGDTIFITTSETMEDLGHAIFYAINTDGLLGGEQICLKPNNQLFMHKYFYYVLRCLYLSLRKYATGLKVFRVNMSDIKKTLIPVPPLTEQKQIADYLDEKCANIDSIIAQKKQIITKLTEYKKSLIFECVTGKKEIN